MARLRKNIALKQALTLGSKGSSCPLLQSFV